MMVNIDCQLDGLYHHLGARSLGMFVRDQLDEVNGVKGLTLAASMLHSMGCSPRLHKKEKPTRAQVFIALCSLATDT